MARDEPHLALGIEAYRRITSAAMMLLRRGGGGKHEGGSIIKKSAASLCEMAYRLAQRQGRR